MTAFAIDGDAADFQPLFTEAGLTEDGELEGFGFDEERIPFLAGEGFFDTPGQAAANTVIRSRAEAAAFLIDEGIKAQEPLFGRVEQKLSEIERLRAELRGMINSKTE